MQEVQRFNKVLKSFVLSGDIILLNLLLWVFGSLWGNRSPFEFSMPLFQNMALMTLCYLVCNIRSGVILHPYPHFSPYTQYKVLPILPFWLETLLL